MASHVSHACHAFHMRVTRRSHACVARMFRLLLVGTVLYMCTVHIHVHSDFFWYSLPCVTSPVYHVLHMVNV